MYRLQLQGERVNLAGNQQAEPSSGSVKFYIFKPEWKLFVLMDWSICHPLVADLALGLLINLTDGADTFFEMSVDLYYTRCYSPEGCTYFSGNMKFNKNQPEWELHTFMHFEQCWHLLVFELNNKTEVNACPVVNSCKLKLFIHLFMLFMETSCNLK